MVQQTQTINDQTLHFAICVFLCFRINQSEIFSTHGQRSTALESGKVELQWFLSKFGNRGDYKLLELFLLPCNQSLLHLKLVKYFVFLKYGILCILDRGKMENPPMSTSIRDEKVNIQFIILSADKNKFVVHFWNMMKVFMVRFPDKN